MSAMTIAKSELILGGQRSGKSRRAEQLAQQWLSQSGEHRAMLVATDRPWDDEMRERIRRHQQLFEVKSPDILQPGPAALTDGVTKMHQIILKWMDADLAGAFKP